MMRRKCHTRGNGARWSGYWTGNPSQTAVAEAALGEGYPAVGYKVYEIVRELAGSSNNDRHGLGRQKLIEMILPSVYPNGAIAA
jgi:hypothetical protein